MKKVFTRRSLVTGIASERRLVGEGWFLALLCIFSCNSVLLSSEPKKETEENPPTLAQAGHQNALIPTQWAMLQIEMNGATGNLGAVQDALQNGLVGEIIEHSSSDDDTSDTEVDENGNISDTD